MNALQYPSPSGILPTFLERYAALPRKRVLEMGTKRWSAESTHHKHMFPDFESYTMTDVEAGIDVDVVADAHSLSGTLGLGQYDVIMACSVWEHLIRPWRAADEIFATLADDGIFFVQTHFCFPEHGYPHDYFRFTEAGLASIFPWAREVVTSYDYACTVTPNDPAVVWNPAAPNFLNVCITGRK